MPVYTHTRKHAYKFPPSHTHSYPDTHRLQSADSRSASFNIDLDAIKQRGQRLRDGAGSGEREAQSPQHQKPPPPQSRASASPAATGNKRSDDQVDAEDAGESSDSFLSDFDDDEEVNIGDSR